jgi:ribose-phosphate pyrophosphokinase
MELLIMCDALKRASAQSITAVLPYFGYARQDRKVVPRTPITAKLVADLLESAGATRVVSMDMHVAQIQGFFHIPSDHLFASPVFLEDIRRNFPATDELVLVSPDAGGVERARAYSKRLDASLAIVDKRRTRANVSEVMNLIGDVRGKDAVLIDDMVDTGGTLTQAALALKSEGARRVVAYAVHPILSGPAVKRIQESMLEEAASSKIRQLSTARLFADAIQRIYSGDSLSSLFV